MQATGVIATKTEMLALQRAGKLGNLFRTWQTPEEFLSSNYQGWVTIRSRRRDSPFMVPAVYWTEVGKVIRRLIESGAQIRDLYLQETSHDYGCNGTNCDGCPRVLNFEAFRTDKYLWVLHGEPGTRLNLRRDLDQNGKYFEQLRANAVLRTYLSSDSWDDLQEIWDRHPGSIVEATEYSRPVGVRNRRLLIWEVRDY